MKIYQEEISQKDGKSENKTTHAYQQLNPKCSTFTHTDPKRRKIEEEQCDYENEEYTMKKESKMNRKLQKHRHHEVTKDEDNISSGETDYYAEDEKETDSCSEYENHDDKQKEIPDYLLSH